LSSHAGEIQLPQRRNNSRVPARNGIRLHRALLQEVVPQDKSQTLRCPDTTAGPSERAGFIDAPQIGPANNASSAMTAPTAIRL